MVFEDGCDITSGIDILRMQFGSSLISRKFITAG